MPQRPDHPYGARRRVRPDKLRDPRVHGPEPESKQPRLRRKSRSDKLDDSREPRKKQ